MSHSSMRYESVPNPPGESVDEVDEDLDEEPDEDHEATELEPLAPKGRTQSPSPSPARSLLSGLFTPSHARSSDRLLVSPVAVAPPTPISSDGVFMNIPAKPSSSRDRNKDDEDLGPDEWIFMSPEQRKKMAPPKYSRIKRDRAPRYTTEYTPPPLPPSPTSRKRSRRGLALKPQINSLPAGSSALFFATVFLSTLLPFVGFFLVYLTSRGRWTSHATRLGSRTGLGLGLFHAGAMMFYIPALLPSVFAASSSVPLILFLVWTAFIGLPLGWRLSLDAGREYMWVKTEERVLRQACVNLGVAAASSVTADDEDAEDIEAGYRYIEGTDIRVRDLRKILAKARDARLARSLRAAGF